MPLVRPPPPPQPSSSPNPNTQAKHLPAFANCPHPTFKPNLTEWYQITSPVPFPDLDICPDCYNTSIKPVHYSRFISRAPPKPENLSTRCDFSDLWIRIAYAWLFTTYAPDLSLLGQVASISPDQDGPCPNLNLEDQEVIKGGKPVATRTWYCLADPKGGALIEDLTVCSHCVKHIELILPGLRGIFRPAADGQRVQATCDLMMLGDGKQRCLSYIDQFVSVAEQQRLSGHLDINPLTTYIKRWALIPFCKREKAVHGAKRYTMPSAVPEFTVCEECYITHIQPLYSATPPPAILSQISSIMSTQDGFICELYSPRLQQYFKDAVATNDLQGYRGKLVARGQKMQEVKVKLEQMKLQHGQQKAQSELHMQMMLMEQSSAMSMSLANTVGGWYAPTDFRPANAQMNQGSQMAVQAAMTLDNMKLLEREWAEYWE